MYIYHKIWRLLHLLRECSICKIEQSSTQNVYKEEKLHFYHSFLYIYIYIDIYENKKFETSKKTGFKLDLLTVLVASSDKN